ncbi:uncharacterized protein G2W53_041067 [Senna tora]|uniref:Uncharacterized protein n=1 Tax=Senna tora TaxID=362788 RepID=A0A834SF49_9FABA|nr:uncharacterized protein G2W53_041067 [Senna tora]
MADDEELYIVCNSRGGMKRTE